MKENFTIKYQNRLHMIMNSKNVPYGSDNTKALTFLKQLRNLKYICVVPLNKNETEIIRFLLKVNNEYSVPFDNICNKFGLSNNELINKIDIIFKVLEKYFSFEEEKKVIYNDSINDFNYNLSIFDCAFNEFTQNILRALNCVYARDLSRMQMSDVKKYLAPDEYEKLLDFFAFYGVLFDEQLEKVRK